ncbi:MAG TPA: YifB family Mg chelatase-like AAA ATPase [Clostridiaceae bacterium]|nr:YifB family Mg chelatase-like AAA ATPase [Clostridiaceae bacterium]
MSVKNYHRIRSCALTGLDGVIVEIEVSILPGLPRFEVTGRGDHAISESRDRVRAAIRYSGYEFPKGRVIAGYAPASLPKQGSAFDLPLALAVLASSDQAIRQAGSPETAAFGELSLNGQVRRVHGALGRLLSLREEGIRHVIGPIDCEREAQAVDSIHYEGVETLKEAVLRYSGVRSKRKTVRSSGEVESECVDAGDAFNMMRGQAEGMRACVIAAAGWHPILMMGAPGCGKTTLASVIPEILPPLTEKESLEISRIYSVTGNSPHSEGLMKRRPFRHTHHTITSGALIGGGIVPKPGECTLAHRGVLFLDEVTEIQPRVLDALREPLETGKIHLARAEWNAVFPADFLFVAACNPCRCGYLLEPFGRCRCDDAAVRRHLSRISGPLFDRFDLVVFLTRVETQDLLTVPDPESEQSSSGVHETRELVEGAWAMQRERASKRGLVNFHNAKVQISDPERFFAISDEAMKFAIDITDRALLSVRSFFSILRIARTIADLEQREHVREIDIAEAYHFKARLPFVSPQG